MTMSVCVGSSCHLKGSYRIIELAKAAVEQNQLADQVELKAAFCLGHCGETGVSVKFDEEIVSGVTEQNFDTIFRQYVLKK